MLGYHFMYQMLAYQNLLGVLLYCNKEDIGTPCAGVSCKIEIEIVIIYVVTFFFINLINYLLTVPLTKVIH